MNNYMIKFILRGVKKIPKIQIIGRFNVIPYHYLNIDVAFETKTNLEENFYDIIKELNNLNLTKYPLQNSNYKFIYLDKIIFNQNITIKELLNTHNKRIIFLDTYMYNTLIRGLPAKIIISQK